jgi:hypothetical protein
MAPIEIQKAGWEALKKQLGLVGALRFLAEFILSSKIRFLTPFGMTGEGLAMMVLVMVLMIPLRNLGLNSIRSG